SDFSFEWTSPNGQPLTTLSPLIDHPGLYQLEVTNLINGCSASVEVLVESDFAAPLVDAGPGGVLTCADTALMLSGTADGGGALLTVLWATSDGNILSGPNTFD
ncbi:hypothetical protein RZS08_57325, partial [Arthrospira platensis SPKY1]|nr:hypothetical protein [Arthrospira platensis SPKY1]